MLECVSAFFLARAKYLYTVEIFKESRKEISFNSYSSIEHFNDLPLPWSHE